MTRSAMTQRTRTALPLTTAKPMDIEALPDGTFMLAEGAGACACWVRTSRPKIAWNTDPVPR